MHVFHKSNLFAMLAMALITLAAACSGGDPEAHRFELEVRDHDLVQGTAPLRVKQNDIVSIVVSTDQPISFHLHGYDITQEAKPGLPAKLDFTASATGSFPFTIHPQTNDSHEPDDKGSTHNANKESSENHEHGSTGEEIELGRLEVRPR